MAPDQAHQMTADQLANIAKCCISLDVHLCSRDILFVNVASGFERNQFLLISNNFSIHSSLLTSNAPPRDSILLPIGDKLFTRVFRKGRFVSMVFDNVITI